MKTITLLFISTFITVGLLAQSEKYIAAMKKSIAEIDSAFIKNDGTKFTEVAAAFERIGNAEKKEWLPYYYAAYATINAAFIKNDPGQMDAIADKADRYIATADSLMPKNSEVALLKAMNATLRLVADPMTRYMEYGQLIEKFTKESIAQDAANPRPHFYTGMSLLNTPKQYGGGCETAKPHLQKAVELYDTFKPVSELHPDWGKDLAGRLLSGCD